MKIRNHFVVKLELHSSVYGYEVIHLMISCPQAVVFHFLPPCPHQKVKRKIYSASSASRAQRAVKLLNIEY